MMRKTQITTPIHYCYKSTHTVALQQTSFIPGRVGLEINLIQSFNRHVFFAVNFRLVIEFFFHVCSIGVQMVSRADYG